MQGSCEEMGDDPIPRKEMRRANPLSQDISVYAFFYVKSQPEQQANIVVSGLYPNDWIPRNHEQYYTETVLD